VATTNSKLGDRREYGNPETPMKSRNEVVAMVRAKIRMLHFSYSTEQSYCGWIARYYDFCTRVSPRMRSEKKAEAFLTMLALRDRVSSRTQNQALAAILFLHKQVLERPLGNIDALRAKRPVHERTAPSRAQVEALRQQVVDRPFVPARLLVDLLYGCGLRVSEPLELRIKDILWSEGHLVVRGAKGGKDRRVPIPGSCIEPLRAQVDFARTVWEADRRDHPRVGVPLPHRLGRKYPKARTAWPWFWVFPARTHCQHPQTGETVRYHILHDRLQQAVREAAAKIGMDGVITPHVLRHGYATHSRESIEALRVLMGHYRIETTSGYRHPEVNRATNPLDDLISGASRGESLAPPNFI
jgi:integrase